MTPPPVRPPFHIGQRVKVYYLADAWRGGYGTIETLTNDGYADIRSEWNPEIIAVRQSIVLFDDASDLRVYPPHKPYVEPQPPARPAPPALDLDAIRARLDGYDEVAYIFRVEATDGREGYTDYDPKAAADMKALIAETERYRRAEKWLLSNLPESVQRVYRIHVEEGKFDHD